MGSTFLYLSGPNSTAASTESLQAQTAHAPASKPTEEAATAAGARGDAQCEKGGEEGKKDGAAKADRGGPKADRLHR